MSTPGLERPLKRPAHFRRSVGEQVKVKTTAPMAGSKTHMGTLVSADEDGITIAVPSSQQPSGEGTEERRVPLRRHRVGANGRRLGCRNEEEQRMNAEMIAALRELEREKGIAFETILHGLAEAMASAYKTWWKQENPDADDDFVGFRAEIDPESGDLRMWKQDLEEIEVPPVEEGAEPTLEMKVLGEEEVEVTDDFKGRIGAQTAKQVIFQKLRDAEREMTYEEFAGREGDVVTGIVQQQERRYTLLDLGQGGGAAAAGRAGADRALPPRRAPQGVHHRGAQGHEGPADRRVPLAPGPAEGAVRDGGARDRGGHRRDQGGGSRARAPLEDRACSPTSPASTRWARAWAPRARACAWS